MEAENEGASLINNSNNKKHQEVINGVGDQVLSDMMAFDSSASDTNYHDAMGHLGGDSITSSFSSFTSKPIPPFLLKIYDMLSNNDTNSLITWMPTGTSFVIVEPHSFAANVLPVYFRHNNFQSFVTQLNSYGFKKISWEKWEYKNENFRRGERHLLRNIKRRNNQVMHTLLQANDSSTSLKEHNLLRTEIMMMKDKQQKLEEKLAYLKWQVARNERDQTKMMMAAQKIVFNLHEHSNAGENDDTEARIKGKRNLEDAAVCLDGVPSTSKQTKCEIMANEQMGKHTMDGVSGVSKKTKCEIVVDDQMEKHPTHTFLTMEDLFGDMLDCTDYIKGIAGETKPCLQ